MLKMTYNIKPGVRLQGAYQRSLTINQNTRMLQITGADTQIRPGFQFNVFQMDFWIMPIRIPTIVICPT